jgi:hypothetical protein
VVWVGGERSSRGVDEAGREIAESPPLAHWARTDMAHHHFQPLGKGRAAAPRTFFFAFGKSALLSTVSVATRSYTFARVDRIPTVVT